MRLSTLILPAALLLLVPGLGRVAAAEEGPTRVDQLLGEGWRFYTEELDFERALESYEEASTNPDANDSQLLEAFEYLAACRFALGDRDGARDALEQLLHINRDHELSDPSHSPDFLQVLDDLRAALPPEVTSPPAGGTGIEDTELPPGFQDPDSGSTEDGSDPPPSNGGRRPWYRTWWFWTITGVVVAGAVTAGVVLGTRDGEVLEPPQGALSPGVVQLPCTIRF